MNDFDISHFKRQDAGQEYLQKVPLFKTFSATQLDSLYQYGEIVQKALQVNVVIEGEATRGIYVILQGKVSVYKNSLNDDKMLRLTYLEDKDFFGELSLFDPAPRSATVIAEVDSYLLYISAQKFQEFLDKYGDPLKVEFYRRCAEELAVRFRHQNDDFIDSQKLLWEFALKRQ